MNPNPVTLSRRLSLISLLLGLQLQSLCLSQSLKQPVTARPFSLLIFHTSPSLLVSHLAVSSLDNKRRPATARPFSLSISHTSPSPSILHLVVIFFLPFRVSTVKDGSSLLQTLRKVHKNQVAEEYIQHLRNQNERLRLEVDQLRSEVTSIRSTKDEQCTEYQNILMGENRTSKTML
ncbi:hypothetical protein C1H46_030455 [Malus baccata]|uniref:Uncharacterized protein n=1 Tax=Malus baccata TaxID=106549 RepID=A0A540LBZ9_MALBA|nr:hypothetical protein C1H46_030455 [Malus baccata]